MLPGACVDVRVVAIEVDVCVVMVLVNAVVFAVDLKLLHFVSAIVR